MLIETAAGTKVVKVGDTVVFQVKVIGYDAPRGKLKRKVVKILNSGTIIVRFAGYSEFMLRPDEILDIEENNNA